MENHTIKNPLEFKEDLRKLETTDPGHANTFNPLNEILINNDVYLNERKVDKEVGKGLSDNNYTAADKAKLDGVAVGAKNIVISNNLTTTTVGSALDAVQGKMVNDSLNAHGNDVIKHLTAAERTTWNAKAGTAVATPTTNGLMAAADKAKLNGVIAGANNTTVVNNLTTTAVGSALDAVQGKALNDKITGMTAINYYGKYSMMSTSSRGEGIISFSVKDHDDFNAIDLISDPTRFTIMGSIKLVRFQMIGGRAGISGSYKGTGLGLYKNGASLYITGAASTNGQNPHGMSPPVPTKAGDYFQMSILTYGGSVTNDGGIFVMEVLG